MNSHDFAEFSESWVTAHAISSSNQTPSVRAVSMCFDFLADYPLDAVLDALSQHARRSRFAPTPADIVEILTPKSEHLSADEAWAMMPMSEAETVVWTKEMAAAYALASPLIGARDKNPARMAFRQAYEREVAKSTSQPVWSVCLGSDASLRETPIRKAAEQGRIAHSEAKIHFLIPIAPDNPIVALLAGNAPKTNNAEEKAQKHWAEMKEALSKAGKADEERKRIAREEQTQRRLAFEAEKQRQLQSVDDRLRHVAWSEMK